MTLQETWDFWRRHLRGVLCRTVAETARELLAEYREVLESCKLLLRKVWPYAGGELLRCVSAEYRDFDLYCVYATDRFPMAVVRAEERTEPAIPALRTSIAPHVPSLNYLILEAAGIVSSEAHTAAVLKELKALLPVLQEAASEQKRRGCLTERLEAELFRAVSRFLAPFDLTAEQSFFKQALSGVRLAFTAEHPASSAFIERLFAARKEALRSAGVCGPRDLDPETLAAVVQNTMLEEALRPGR